MTETTVIVAWISFAAIVLAACITMITTFVLRFRENRQRIKHEIMEERKHALLDALRIVDHVFASSQLSEGENSYPP